MECKKYVLIRRGEGNRKDKVMSRDVLHTSKLVFVVSEVLLHLNTYSKEYNMATVPVVVCVYTVTYTILQLNFFC